MQAVENEDGKEAVESGVEMGHWKFELAAAEPGRKCPSHKGKPNMQCQCEKDFAVKRRHWYPQTGRDPEGWEKFPYQAKSSKTR